LSVNNIHYASPPKPAIDCCTC